MKKLITALLVALTLSCGSVFAEDTNTRPHLPEDVKAQVEQAMQTHHTNMLAERDRFRGEVEKILVNHPEALAKMKTHWVEMDKRREIIKDKIEDRRENRKERREQHGKNIK